MSALDWLLLAVGLGYGLYWYLTRYYGYWKTVGVPTLPGVLPGVGNMWDAFVCKASSSWLYTDFYKNIQSQPAVGLYDFRKPALLLKSPSLIQDVLIKDFSSFHDNATAIDPELDIHMSRNPFFLRGDSWKTMRQQINPAFSPAKLKAMFPLIVRVCEEFNNYMEDHVNDDTDINHVSGLFASDVVAKCAFGIDGNAFTAKDFGEFYQQGHKMGDSSFYNPVYMVMRQYLPIVNKIFRKSFVSKEATRFFVGLVTQVEDYRVKNPEKVPDDYLQYLLNLKKKDPSFTMDDVVAQCLTFFTDGFESNALIASFVMYELTVNPDIQETVRREVKAMESFSYDNIVSLDLLDRVIKETIRKYVVFGPPKICTKDHILQAEGHTYPVRRGHLVIIPTYAIHHDPEHYPDPDKFDPDRFLPDKVKSRHPMTFIGFGGGPRMCLGNRFATIEIKVFIANLLTNFRLVKCDKTVEKVTLSRVQIMPVSEGGLWCRFQKV